MTDAILQSRSMLHLFEYAPVPTKEGADFRVQDTLETESAPTLRDHIVSMGTRVRDVSAGVLESLSDKMERVSEVTEAIARLSAKAAISSAVVYVAIEALTKTPNIAEATAVLLSALSIGALTQELQRAPDTSSLRAWRNRD